MELDELELPGCPQATIARKGLRWFEDVSSLRDVAADTDAADSPHGLGMQCHCTGVMPTGRACSDRPGFAKFARVTEMLVVPDENCGVVPRMSGA